MKELNDDEYIQDLIKKISKDIGVDYALDTAYIIQFLREEKDINTQLHESLGRFVSPLLFGIKNMSKMDIIESAAGFYVTAFTHGLLCKERFEEYMEED